MYGFLFAKNLQELDACQHVLLPWSSTPTGEASEVIQEFSKVPFAEPTYLGDVEKVYITCMYV